VSGVSDYVRTEWVERDKDGRDFKRRKGVQ
jgi:hypothetical protein